MKLIIVRHGETHENNLGIIQGWNVGTLNDKGQEQAKKVALRLKDEKIDIVYSSDLERTKQTTEEIMKFHPKTPVIYEKILRERNSGEWEGKTEEERKLSLQNNNLEYLKHKPRGGESPQDLQKRVISFYDNFIQKYNKETILIVGHGGPLTLLYLHIFEKDIKEFHKYHPQNTAVTILEIDDNKKHTVHVLNCVKHLQ
ncbi:MAG: histidine phosphatase family protein [Candidatus Woesearchaeota archaeon]|jgi:probable phosphoglycerate mutase